MNTVRLFVDLAKILGRAVVDVVDIGNYKITVIVERKIDGEDIGILIDHVSFEKRMSPLEARTMMSKVKELINK